MDFLYNIIPVPARRVNGQIMGSEDSAKLNGKRGPKIRFLWKFSQQEP